MIPKPSLHCILRSDHCKRLISHPASRGQNFPFAATALLSTAETLIITKQASAVLLLFDMTENGGPLWSPELLGINRLEQKHAALPPLVPVPLCSGRDDRGILVTMDEDRVGVGGGGASDSARCLCVTVCLQCVRVCAHREGLEMNWSYFSCY